MFGVFLHFIMCCVLVKLSVTEIETYTFDNFPKNKIAVHMPCEESNMFATKCMCHLKCTDPSCKNAKELCKKYEISKGCKYMLIRGFKNKIATLKRVPTVEEMMRFDISTYPNTSSGLTESKWTDLQQKQKSIKADGPLIRDLVSSMGTEGTKLVDKIFKQTNTNKYCGSRYFANASSSSSRSTDVDRDLFLSRGIAMTALSYHSPLTLVNSLRTWQSSGFLSLLREKSIILNDPLPAETAMALEHGLKIIEPKDIPNAKTSKPNVLTIGAAFWYALENIQSEYLVFLENDFKMDTSLSVKEIQAQLIAAAGMLDSGSEIVRLNSRKYQGCGTFKDCAHHGIHLTTSDKSERKRNWFAFYCRGQKDSGPHVSDCLFEPDFRCFTSWDTNWTLNAVMVKKSTMMNKKYNTGVGGLKSLPQIGLDQYRKQDGFESVMGFSLPWQDWRVPVCIAYDGLFIHEEIETGA